MDVATSDLIEKSVLWAASTVNEYGDRIVASRVEIDSNWQTGSRMLNNLRADNVNATGVVFVDREIAVGSILWRGELDDLTSSPENLKQVTSYGEVPSLGPTNCVRRWVLIDNWNNQLPGTG